ncbi:MAG TPA: trypsin-like serine protease [Solirubrobacteraceae bacterium]|jgi:hypothetical protein|nr:trypsin-like serine protease [Solirubrobacteraceae bacterium]
MLLTAAHVLGSLSAAHPLGQREAVLRAGVAAASSGDPRIGDVVFSHPAQPCIEIELDACVVRVDDNVELTQTVRETITSGTPRDLTESEEMIRVHKRGLVSGLTTGWLDPIPSSLTTRAEGPNGWEILREYTKGWLVIGEPGPFAAPGDSGSIVVDDDDCVVGLIVALETQYPRGPLKPEDPALVVPIVDVLRGLGVELTGPARACTLV